MDLTVIRRRLQTTQNLRVGDLAFSFLSDTKGAKVAWNYFKVLPCLRITPCPQPKAVMRPMQLRAKSIATGEQNAMKSQHAGSLQPAQHIHLNYWWKVRGKISCITGGQYQGGSQNSKQLFNMLSKGLVKLCKESSSTKQLEYGSE